VSAGPLRLSLDVTAVPAAPAGAGRYTLELAGALARRPDVDLVLFARRGDAVRWRELAAADGGDRPEVLAVAPRPRPLRLAWEQARLGALVRGSGVAVHHGPHYTMPERARRPVVVTVHDCTFFDHPEWHERSKVVLFRRAIRVAARRAAAVVCVSATTAERLAEVCPPTGPVVVAPHGVDHARFSPAESSPGADRSEVAAAGVDPDRPYVLFLGTVEPRKDVPTLVRAFARLGRSHPEAVLVLAGRPGWGTAAVDRAVVEAGLADRLVRTGYVADAAVPALLRAAAAVAYPSLEEGYGLPALEALACGAPLVTTEGTAMAELAGGAALLVAPGDEAALAGALEAVLSERGGSAEAERRRRGLAAAAGRTWEESAARHLDAYRLAGH
jgi:glycosyltransferase involved in cell wall biosynthesis